MIKASTHNSVFGMEHYVISQFDTPYLVQLHYVDAMVLLTASMN